MNATTIDQSRMRCMEVWGGNQAVERSVQTAGLRIWVYSRPYGAGKSGGDVHYLSSCASGRITRILLADVSGHGEGVSQVAIALRDLMRRNVNYIRQSRFVQAMNQQFSACGQQDVFATALVSTFFAPTRSFALCNAGHPEPLLFQKETGRWQAVHSVRSATDQIADTPFGIREEATYGEFVCKLHPGDMVLSFSDAVTESRDETGKPIGGKGVLRLLGELDAAKPDSLIPQLRHQLEHMDAGNLKEDDVTLLLIQASGGGATLKDNLLAPVRLLRSVYDRTAIR